MYATCLTRLQQDGLAKRCYSTAPSSPSGAGKEQQANPPQTDAADSHGNASGGLSTVPTLPRLLGLGGLAPFIALAPPIASSIPLIPPEIMANAALLQIGYGATIASFLGGIHWTAAMTNYGPATAKDNNNRYLWSVIPCLAAWPGIAMSPGPGAFVVASSLLAAYSVDKSFAARNLLPPWYMALRLPLTVTAVSSLAITFAHSCITQ